VSTRPKQLFALNASGIAAQAHSEGVVKQCITLNGRQFRRAPAPRDPVGFLYNSLDSD